MPHPLSKTLIEIALEVTDPVEWAAMMLTKVAKPGMSRDEAMERVRRIVRRAITLSREEDT